RPWPLPDPGAGKRVLPRLSERRRAARIQRRRATAGASAQPASGGDRGRIRLVGPRYQRRPAPGRERYHTASTTTPTATTAAAAQNAPASSRLGWNQVTTPTAASAAETASHEARSINWGRVMRRTGGITAAECRWLVPWDAWLLGAGWGVPDDGSACRAGWMKPVQGRSWRLGRPRPVPEPRSSW